MIEYLDSHCHLNDPALLPQAKEVVERASLMHVSTLLVIGYDLESSRQAVEIAERFSHCYAAVGYQPENLEGISEEKIQGIKELAQHEKAVAIGEIGLDYHWYHEPEEHENQKKWFIRQIELANELHLPVSIHAREAYGDTLELLKAHPVEQKGVLHCYSGSPELLREFAKLGYYFGFDGPITFKNAKTPKACVVECPIDRLLCETDSPYMAPEPLRGTRNEPSNIPLIVKKMAELKGMSEEDVASAIARNFENLFHVKL